MNDFAATYLADLKSLPLLDLTRRTLVVYHEDLEAAQGTLPQNLRDFLQLEQDGLDQLRIEKLQNISQTCDEFNALCAGSACSPSDVGQVQSQSAS